MKWWSMLKSQYSQLHLLDSKEVTGNSSEYSTIEGLEVSRLKLCAFDESRSLTWGLILFGSIFEASLDDISNDGCDLISEWLDEEGKRSKEEEILVEMIIFSEVASCLEE